MTRTALTTKRVGLIWLAIGLFAGLALTSVFGGLTVRADGHATGLESVRTNGVEQNFVPGQSRSKTEVFIYGSGFAPGTEVFTIISDSNGVLTDITIPAAKRRDGGGTVYPLVANADGAWATNWRIGRFTRKGVGGEGMFSLQVMDTSFNTLATTPIALCNNAGGKGGRVEEVKDEAGTVTQEADPIPDHCSA